LAGQREINKGQPEVRVLRSGAASPEAVGFPLVAQVALLADTCASRPRKWWL